MLDLNPTLWKNYPIDQLCLIYLILLGALTSLSLPPFNYVVINFLTFSLFYIFLVKKIEFYKNKKIYEDKIAQLESINEIYSQSANIVSKIISEDKKYEQL